MTNPQDLCERLRKENSCYEGFYEHCVEAADLIEAQAARIAEFERILDGATQEDRVKTLEAKCTLLAASLDQAERHAAEVSRANFDLEAHLRERGEPVPFRSIIQAIYVVGKEAARRGEMYPQTSDEQVMDRKAERRVAEEIEWYATKGGAIAESLDGWPKIAHTPAAAASEDKPVSDELIASYMCSDEQATQSLVRLKTYQWRDTGPLETADA